MIDDHLGDYIRLPVPGEEELPEQALGHSEYRLLERFRSDKTPVDLVFLDGVRLPARILGFTQACLIVDAGRGPELFYKHGLQAVRRTDAKTGD